MGLNHSPKIVTSNLVFTYDMSNTDKSWKGAAVTNQFAVPTPDGNNNVTFQYQGTGTFKRVTSGTYGEYTITSNDVVYQYDLGTTGCHYHGGATNIPAGVYPTFTFDYYISPDAANFPTNSQLAAFENYGQGGQNATVSCPNSLKGVWQTVTFSGGLTPTTGLQASYLYPGGCNTSYLASSGYILYRNPQVIYSAVNNFTAPFVGPTGVRSDTQAILDPIGKNTLIANSLSYASNNTFSFNGANSYIETPRIPGTGTGSSSLTWSVWCSPATTGNGDIINMRDVSTGWDMCPIYSTGQRFYGKVWNGPVIAGLSTYNLNQYYYLTVVYDNAITDKIKFYINAELQGFNQSSYSASGNTSGNSLYFGRAGNQATLTHFNGKIPAAAIYTKALSAEEVKQNFNALRGRYGI